MYIKEQATQEKLRRRRKKRQAAVDLLGGICKDCGVEYPTCVYDFHHTDPSVKESIVSDMVHKDMKLERILNEASKCELLCSNCHRLRHFL
jgi:hypothetical protein